MAGIMNGYCVPLQKQGTNAVEIAYISVFWHIIGQLNINVNQNSTTNTHTMAKLRHSLHDVVLGSGDNFEADKSITVANIEGEKT